MEKGFGWVGFYHVSALLQELDLPESRGLHFLLSPSCSAQALICAYPLKSAAAIANPGVDEEKLQASNQLDCCRVALCWKRWKSMYRN